MGLNRGNLGVALIDWEKAVGQLKVHVEVETGVKRKREVVVKA